MKATHAGQQFSYKANVNYRVSKGPLLAHCFSCYMSKIFTNAQTNPDDDTDILYADKNVTVLETTVNMEL